MLGYCNVGASAFIALARAQAPIADLEYLLAKGMELKLDSDPAKGLVNQAIVDGNIRLMGWFLERGLDINAYVKSASNPLWLAVENRKDAMALYLVTQGADVGFKRYRDGQSALHLSMVDWQTGLATILLEQGADPNIRSDGGYTPLHRAVWNCDVQITLTLLEHGADPDIANDKGETPRDAMAGSHGIRRYWCQTPVC